MDYEQMEIDITLESDRDLKENMQATAKLAAQAQRIMDDLYYGESGKPTPMEEYMDEQEAGASEDDGFEEADNNKEDAEEMEE